MVQRYDQNLPFKHYPTGVKDIWVAYGVTGTDEDVLPLTLEVKDDEVRISYEVEEVTSIHRSLADVAALQSYLPQNTTSYLLKRATYELCQIIFARSLPWGMLTGIRPGKILAHWERQGVSAALFEVLLRQVYLVQPNKAKLLVDIFQRQAPMRREKSPKDVHVYVHIPFCPTKCHYCSFASYDNHKWAKWHEPYLRALQAELKHVMPLLQNYHIQSLYVGGGTPTALDDELFRSLMATLQHYFTNVPEVTVEAGRPDSLSAAKWEAMTPFVSQVSINAQTSHDDSLVLMGRAHQFADVVEAFDQARQWGISAINTDLILGLPYESEETMKQSIRDVADLGPEIMTVHTLALKRGSQLLKEEMPQPVPLKDTVDWSLAYLTEKGYEPYYLYRQKRMTENMENVGYAKPGHINRYNINMMEELSSTMGFGLGAATKWFTSSVDFETQHNIGDLHRYIKEIDDVITKKVQLIER